ncbi:NUDIX hydrolase [Metabacillus litoralis]|uniref:NUDIX hydrolase n=1 Tax=Metabacillus litoralis TaxID=152268 RepID=UPI001CFE6628|nr:NUDIX hydrolase [Metabacillus litoralis]
MTEEILKIFDEDGNYKGMETRQKVHEKGYWHETFHCWLISVHNGDIYIYFQLRCEQKKDYPNLLDITAAGHLLSCETVEDGVREVNEEIGVALAFSDLISLGVIKERLYEKCLIDHELCHVFLYETKHSFEHFFLQKEEVSGIYRVRLDDFIELWFGQQTTIHSEGFKENPLGEKITDVKVIHKQSFVPHEDHYLKKVVENIQIKIAQKNI